MQKMLAAVAAVAAFAGPAISQAAPRFPPNGTYVYSIWTNGRRVGTTTVVILRRDGLDSIDIYERGSYDGTPQKFHGRIRGGDLLPIQWDSAYAGAPFMAGYVGLPSILGAHTAPTAVPIVSAFWSHVLSQPVRALYPKAALDDWPDDIGVSGSDFTLYFDAQSGVVHEGLFPTALLAVHLESVSKDTSAASSFTP
jgi:hypothetical protein